MSSNPAQVEMYSDTTLCEKVCQLFAVGRWFSPGPPVSSTNKIDRHESGVKHHQNNPNLQMQVSKFHHNGIRNPRKL